MVTLASSPVTTPVVRKPQRRMTQVVNGFIPILPRNVARTSIPDWNASIPKPIWNSRGSRNGTVLIVARNTVPPVTVSAKVGDSQDGQVQQRLRGP